ncbi:DUF1254 domain-containing protein [Rubinisphaera brasiliensis]|uniref:DUF1254 domain-containing protein n=1 Tax=Rubinisphaera brasiliensis (strain ATCC 49424 / DSM 5305 / JCM 21570 / IAM 15109 / NBRC 103401 / IFAM 1448) TaxID=756272 RepID=F0SSW1_RUBBR|nr:DUF1254 domain-containing protein [Rubinisphaera brasiliensis]ADY61439.1 protein of unknown function DUF1214 [Rubinisphaera brasiliensis DSM 5305]
MKYTTTLSSWLCCLLATTGLFAQQVPLAKSTADLAHPSTEVNMPVGYAETVAAMAYVWGWPLVNQHNRRAKITQAPEPALMNGTIPVAPAGRLAMLHDYIKPEQRFVACPNQDVVYGLGYMYLDQSPVVIQVPDFKERFWVYAMYDARTDQFSRIGKPYGSKPGFYLVVGPNWKGEAPEGITAVVRSSTEFGMVVPRVFQDDTAEDRQAIQPFINQVLMYPLSEYDGTMKTKDWSQLSSLDLGTGNTGGETKWVVPEQFFDELKGILEDVPPLPGEEAMYAQFHQMLTVAEKDKAIKQAIVKTAIETEAKVISQFLRWKHNGTPAGRGWNRSTNNAAWGVDYFDRTGTARSNIYDNKIDETRYYYTDHDSSGHQLNGKGSYEITFAAGQEPPVDGFWSLTLYDKAHFFAPNELNRFSLGTKNKDLTKNSDGSLTIYVSAASPGKDKETNWLPAPKDNFSLYIRAYWGQKGIIDGSWTPPEIKELQ